MAKVDQWFDYWDVRIRDPRQFETFRTPDWATHAATVMAKEWIIARQIGYSRPDQVPRQLVDEFPFEGEVHARQAKYRNSNRWATQSVLIPMDLVEQSIAPQLACYIANRLDKNESPTCALFGSSPQNVKSRSTR